MFEQIKQRVKEGRWEVIGGMWVEPDLNMPDGESLVRQILVGKRYFQKNFGADIKIGWNPDSFGYNWQLPQIYKKSGIDYFVTSKLLWATDYTKFPYRLFWWEAPDGSRLLTYFPHEYANEFQPRTNHAGFVVLCSANLRTQDYRFAADALLVWNRRPWRWTNSDDAGSGGPAS